MKKKLLQMGLDPVTHRPRLLSDPLNLLTNLQHILDAANIVNTFTNNPAGGHIINNALRLLHPESDTTQQLAKLHLLQNMLQANPAASNNSLPDTTLLNDVLGFNNLQDLYDGGNSIGFSSQSIQPNFQNFEAHHEQLPYHHYQQQMNGGRNSSGCREDSQEFEFDGQLGSSSNSLPKLVSASPGERSSVKLAENYMTSSSCNTLEMWGDFMNEDVNNDAYWKDFIE